MIHQCKCCFTSDFQATYRKVFEDELEVPGYTNGVSITVLLTSCLTGLESAVRQLNLCFYLQNRLIQTSNGGSMVR